MNTFHLSPLSFSSPSLTLEEWEIYWREAKLGPSDIFWDVFKVPNISTWARTNNEGYMILNLASEMRDMTSDAWKVRRSGTLTMTFLKYHSSKNNKKNEMLISIASKGSCKHVIRFHISC